MELESSFRISGYCLQEYLVGLSLTRARAIIYESKMESSLFMNCDYDPNVISILYTIPRSHCYGGSHAHTPIQIVSWSTF